VAASRKMGRRRSGRVSSTQRARSRRLGTLALLVLAGMIHGIYHATVNSVRGTFGASSQRITGDSVQRGGESDGDSEHLTTPVIAQELDTIDQAQGK